MTLSQPVLELAIGGAQGLLDGLSGFLAPSLAPVTGSVMAFSLMKGLVSGLAIGYVSKRFHSMLLGILAGVAITAVLSLLVILRAGMRLCWALMLRACYWPDCGVCHAEVREKRKSRASAEGSFESLS
jgi:hypothetical protein